MDNNGLLRLERISFARKGASLFEFLVATLVLSLLSLFFFDRLLTYQELAEKTTVEVTAINMRAGLRYRVAELLLHQQDREVANLVGGNPIKWLELPPPNYLGELSAPKWEEIPPGSWYFDVKKGEVLYRLKRARHFVPNSSGQQELRFRVTASFRKAAEDSTVMIAEGVTLILVEPYQWF
jgi:hypothetical protein